MIFFKISMHKTTSFKKRLYVNRLMSQECLVQNVWDFLGKLLSLGLDTGEISSQYLVYISPTYGQNLDSKSF